MLKDCMLAIYAPEYRGEFKEKRVPMKVLPDGRIKFEELWRCSNFLWADLVKFIRNGELPAISVGNETYIYFDDLEKFLAFYDRKKTKKAKKSLPL